MSTNQRAPSSAGSTVAQAGTRALQEAQVHNQRPGAMQPQIQSAYRTLSSQTTAGGAAQNQTYSPLQRWQNERPKEQPWVIVDYSASRSTQNGQEQQEQRRNA